MGLQSLSYYLFLPLTAAVYFRLPARLQTGWLGVCSLVFFGLNTPFDLSQPVMALAPWLAVGGVFALLWCLGPAIQKAPAPQKKRLVRRGVIALVALLGLFKYYNYSPLPTLLAGTALARLPFPLGISFFTFAAIGYLADVGRGDAQPAKTPESLFVFLFFFGTITSGPICRAGKLLPQLEAEHRFEATRTADALRLFALGLWKKVALADLLALYCDEVFRDIPGHGGPALLLACVGYTFYLYFDFCGYSEMARASGLMLGLELPENFKTPFYATNFSTFWTRWHISLSSWLQDYIFTPLVWADVSHLPFMKGQERFSPLFCIFMVFFLSGFWHGSTLPFVVWGLLMAFYRIGEELLHQRLGKPKRKAPARVVRAKRLGVFALWTVSMVFFRVGSGPDTAGVGDAFAILSGWFRGWGFSRFLSEVTGAISAGFYADPRMIAGYLLFLAVGLGAAFWLDSLRFRKFKSKPAELVLASQKPAVRWGLYYFLVVSILVGLIAQNGGFGGVSFAYGNF